MLNGADMHSAFCQLKVMLYSVYCPWKGDSLLWGTANVLSPAAIWNIDPWLHTNIIKPSNLLYLSSWVNLASIRPNSPAKCYARLNRVSAHSSVMDHASCITTRSSTRSIRIIQGSEHAVIFNQLLTLFTHLLIFTQDLLSWKDTKGLMVLLC